MSSGGRRRGPPEDLRYPHAFGPYELLGRLGQGASGAAHLARPSRSARGVPSPVVIKRLHATVERKEEFILRFRHEAEIAVKVDSPHIAKVYDVGAVDGRAYIALEYVPGWTLGKLLGVCNHRHRPPPVQVCAEIARQFLLGLAALHEAVDERGQRLDVVHRDLSPKNLMVGDEGRVRIIDLGLGKSRAQDWKTRAGRVMGSPGYMPPEQIAGRGVDQSADLYAAAVVIHELFTAERYISVDDPVTMLREALHKRYAPVRDVRPDVPAELDEVLEAAMRGDPSRRTVSAVRLAEQLLGLFGEGPSWPTAVGEWVRSTLPNEQSARRAEVRRVLALPRLEEEMEPDLEGTEVWVVRKGVDHNLEARSRPRMTGAATLVAPAAEPTRITAGPDTTVDPSGLPSEAVVVSGGLKGEPLRIGAAFVAGIFVGAMAMRLVPTAAPVAAAALVPPAPAVAPSIVEPTPAVAARPKPEAAPPAPAPSTPAPAPLVPVTEAPSTPKPVRIRRDRPSDPPKRPRSRLSRAERVARLAGRIRARATELRRSSDPKVVQAASRALMQLRLAEQVPNLEVRERQLNDIGRALDAS